LLFVTFLEAAEHFAHPEQAHGDNREVKAAEQRIGLESQPRSPELGIGADT
jgi:hypothetical protein